MDKFEKDTLSVEVYETPKEPGIAAATILRTHPDTVLFLDKASASGL